MALKFLNKKGWHTGSLRNIENVWKAEQKQEAEQKKLEELRKQIHEEREKSEFRALQEQAGLVPRQERLDFLYDSGLAVGKGASSSEGGVSFKALEEEKPDKPSAGAPGALFEETEKPQSANDAWRKLHSDPLLLIRQREQDALARLKNNPVQMALIRKSVEESKGKEKDRGKKGKEKNREKKDKKTEREKDRKKHHRSSSEHHKHSSSRYHSESEDNSAEDNKRRNPSSHTTAYNENRHGRTRPDSEYELKGEESQRNSRHEGKYSEHSSRNHFKSRRDTDSEDDTNEGDRRRKSSNHKLSSSDKHHRIKQQDSEYGLKEEGRRNDRHKESYREHSPSAKSTKSYGQYGGKRYNDKSRRENNSPEGRVAVDADKKEKRIGSSYDNSARAQHESQHRRRNVAPKLSEEERAARLREMQNDAELHEEQRWKRLKKAEEEDAIEAKRANESGGKNFLDAAKKSVYGADKGGSATIEESVRRRTHYLQGRSDAEGNAFRR